MHARAAQNLAGWNGSRTWMDNDKTDGEGQVCTGQTSGVEGTTADRNHGDTPEAKATATTATTETSTMSALASKVETVETTPTTAAVEAPTASEQCIPGGTNTSEATTVPISVEHIHATATSKWIPTVVVGTTNRRMKGRAAEKYRSNIITKSKIESYLSNSTNNNQYAALATRDDDNNTVTIRNCSTPVETANKDTNQIQISKELGIADEGATGHFRMR